MVARGNRVAQPGQNLPMHLRPVCAGEAHADGFESSRRRAPTCWGAAPFPPESNRYVSLPQYIARCTKDLALGGFGSNFEGIGGSGDRTSKDSALFIRKPGGSPRSAAIDANKILHRVRPPHRG